jgi:hypothetical protein
MRASVRGLILLAVLALVAAACSNDDESASDESSTPTSTETASESAASTTSTADTATQGAMEGIVEGDLTFTLAGGFGARSIGEGVKPDVALAPDGTPGITYLLEDISGFIAYADAASGWTPDQVVQGYLYGPIGLAYAPDGGPHIGYHDHQDTEFQQDKGDLTVAVRDSTGWTIDAARDDGHDGWDSTVAIGPDGVVRAAGIDPEQFDSTDGVEYYELVDGTWEVTAIGSGPVAYEFNVSLAVDPDGNPALTYYDTTNTDLKYASRQDGAWSIETVDTDDDVGRYSSLAFDSTGNPHISYLRLDDTTTGTVRYATRTGDTWATADVDSLTDLRIGFSGARRVTAVAVGPDDRPTVAYSDESVVKLATSDGSAWSQVTLVEAGDRPLGQLVSLELSADGIPHLAIFEVTSESPLTGVVAYITST